MAKITAKSKTAEKKEPVVKTAVKKPVNKKEITKKAPVTKQAVKPAPKTKSQPKPKTDAKIVELPVMDQFPTIRKGSTDKAFITVAQANLINRGYELKLNGKFDEKMADVVAEFQKDVGMKMITGSIGPKTWEALQNSDVHKEQSKPEPKPASAFTIVDPKPVKQQATNSECRVLIEGLTRYQADLLVKIFKGSIECRIL